MKPDQIEETIYGHVRSIDKDRQIIVNAKRRIERSKKRIKELKSNLQNK